MFPILLVDPNSLIGDEQLGSKSKFWFEHENKPWLFKLARDHTGEDWAEKVAAEVAKFVPVEAARVELAQYQGHRGSASLSFIAENESLVHGNEILAGQIFGYDRQKKLKQSDHTFDNIVAAVRTLVGGAEWYHELLKDIAKYIVLDGLVCNTDRHHENWDFSQPIEKSMLTPVVRKCCFGCPRHLITHPRWVVSYSMNGLRRFWRSAALRIMPNAVMAAFIGHRRIAAARIR